MVTTGMSRLGSIRRFETQAEIEAKKKRRIKIMAFALLFLMLASSAGYAVSQIDFSGSSEENLDQTEQTNPDQFVNQNVGYPIDYNGQRVFLKNPQDQVSEIPVFLTDLKPENYGGETLYIDSDSQELLQEISYTLGQFSARVQQACYGDCEENLPEKDCTSNLIVFRSSETESKVEQRDKCVFIDGNLKSVDAFLYKLFGK